MRTWIFNRIKAALPSAFGNRVISSGAADSPTAPFVVIQMGVEQPVLGMPASAQVQTIPFIVWVHDKPGSMLNIDDAAVALKHALPTPDGAAVGGMSVFECKWDSTGEDAYDDHYSTNTRPVRFVLTTHG
jgi:hypothetical protein